MKKKLVSNIYDTPKFHQKNPITSQFTARYICGIFWHTLYLISEARAGLSNTSRDQKVTPLKYHKAAHSLLKYTNSSRNIQNVINRVHYFSQTYLPPDNTTATIVLYILYIYI